MGIPKAEEETMQIKVKFMASYSFSTGVDRLTVDIPENSTVDRLIKILDQQFEKAHLDRKQTIVAVNSSVSTGDHTLNNGDTVLIFHQMSGG